MKLLFDENFPGRLVDSLADLYPNSEHALVIGLGGADDGAVWDYAKAGGFTIVSKDSDFFDRSVMAGAPPKVIWLRLGNCTTRDVERLLRSAHETIHLFIEQDSETCLMLGRR